MDPQKFVHDLRTQFFAQAHTPIKPPKPLTALHVGWERQPGTGASLWVVAWHSDRLRAVSMPVRNGVPR